MTPIDEATNKFMIAATSYAIAHGQDPTLEEAFKAGFREGRKDCKYCGADPELLEAGFKPQNDTLQALKGFEAFAKAVINRIDHGDIVFAFDNIPLTVTALKKALEVIARYEG